MNVRWISNKRCNRTCSIICVTMIGNGKTLIGREKDMYDLFANTRFGITAINQTNRIINDSMQRLTSGKNLMKDNPAAMSSAISASAQAESLRQANNNIQTGISAIQVAQEGYKGIRESLTAIRGVLVKMSDETLSEDERNNLKSQIEDEATHMMKIADNTTFNGRNLLLGDFSEKGLRVQTGANVGDHQNVKFHDLLSSLRQFNHGDSNRVVLNHIDAEESAQWVTSLDASIKNVLDNESSLATSENILSRRLSMNERMADLQQNYADRIQTVDEAKEQSKLAAAFLRQQSTTALMSIMRSHEASITRILFNF